MKTTGDRTTTAIVFVLIAVCIATVDAQPRARAASSTRSVTGTRPDSSAKTTERDPVVQTVLELSDRESTVPLPD